MTGLTEGAKYYFAVKAYDTTRTMESPFSNEISYTMPVTVAVPTANFTASPTCGNATSAVNPPITTGTVISWKWDFPGSYTPSVINTTAKVTTATYVPPGTYSASLTETDPDGSTTKTAPNLINVMTTSLPTPTPTPHGVAESSKLELVAAYGFKEAVRINTEHSGKALKFDGIKTGSLSVTKHRWTFQAARRSKPWVYPTEWMTYWATVIMKEETAQQVYTLYANSDQNKPAIDRWINGGERILSGGPQLEPNQWWHVAGTYNGQKEILYVNGTKVSERAQSGAITTSTEALRIGGDSIWDDLFKRYIDEVNLRNSQIWCMADLTISLGWHVIF